MFVHILAVCTCPKSVLASDSQFKGCFIPVSVLYSDLYPVYDACYWTDLILELDLYSCLLVPDLGFLHDLDMALFMTLLTMHIPVACLLGSLGTCGPIGVSPYLLLVSLMAVMIPWLTLLVVCFACSSWFSSPVQDSAINIFQHLCSSYPMASSVTLPGVLGQDITSSSFHSPIRYTREDTLIILISYQVRHKSCPRPFTMTNAAFATILALSKVLPPKETMLHGKLLFFLGWM